MKPLRIGLFLDDLKVPYWTYLVIERILKNQQYSIELVVTNKAASTRLSWTTKLKYHWRDLHKILLNKITNFIFNRFLKSRLIQVDAFETKDLSPLLVKIPALAVTPLSKKHTDEFSSEDVEKIKSKNCDVILRFGFRILKGEVLKSATCGIWSLHHGDNQVNRGGPAGFWEVFFGWPTTGSILQILTEHLDDGLILSRSYSSTQFRSVYKSRNAFYLKAVTFFERKLCELRTLGCQDFLKKVYDDNRDPQFYSHPLYVMPSFLTTLKHLIRSCWRFIRDRVDGYLFLEQWILLYKVGNGLSTSPRQFKKIIPPKDRFWADPHVIYRDNKYFIFIEEFISKTNKGHISLIVMDEQGRYTQPTKIIEEETHLSYPFIFCIGSDLYLLPENSNAKALNIYKCLKFPDQWEKVRNISEGMSLVDATLLYKDNKWWMFASRAEIDGSANHDELFLYSRQDLFSGTWQPHPSNPIVSDVRRARPAGRIFEHKGQFYRPAQDCSVRYGYGLKLHRIDTLNESSYGETQVSELLPRWRHDIKATHTLAFENNLTVIDGILKRRRVG